MYELLAWKEKGYPVLSIKRVKGLKNERYMTQNISEKCVEVASVLG